MRVPFLLPLASALALAACGSGNDDGVVDTAASDSAMDGAVADPGAPVTAEDAAAQIAAPGNAQEFVEAMAAGDLFEIESSKLALTMAKDPQLKAFAQKMIEAHTASSADLKSVVAGMTPPPVLEPRMTLAQQGDIAALKAAVDNFDAIYAERQLGAHQRALAMLSAYARGGDAQPLKDFATKTSEIVEGHLEMLQKIRP